MQSIVVCNQDCTPGSSGTETLPIIADVVVTYSTYTTATLNAALYLDLELMAFGSIFYGGQTYIRPATYSSSVNWPCINTNLQNLGANLLGLALQIAQNPSAYGQVGTGLDRDYFYFALLAYVFFAGRYLKHRRDKMRREREKPIELDLFKNLFKNH